MKLEELINIYEDEMMAEGAWSGHAYAADYLHDLRERFIEEFDKISKRYLYKGGYFYKDNKMCLSTKEMNIYDYAKHGKFVLSTDYAGLISKVYESKLDTEDKDVIADALNDAFKNKMSEAVSDAYEITKGEN